MIKVTFYFIAFCVITYSMGCKNNLSTQSRKNNERSNAQENFITPIIDLKNGKDTNNVSFNYAFETYKLHYYKNLPQYFTLDDSRIAKNIEMTHYAFDNKGLYASFDVDSNKFKAFGAKYLDGKNGIDLVLKPNGIEMKSLKIWTDYTNDGLQYNFSNDGTRIMTYRYQNGIIVDSFVLHK
jgi:hypothetical protein